MRMSFSINEITRKGKNEKTLSQCHHDTNLVHQPTYPRCALWCLWTKNEHIHKVHCWLFWMTIPLKSAKIILYFVPCMVCGERVTPGVLGCALQTGVFLPGNDRQSPRPPPSSTQRNLRHFLPLLGTDRCFITAKTLIKLFLNLRRTREADWVAEISSQSFCWGFCVFAKVAYGPKEIWAMFKTQCWI